MFFWPTQCPDSINFQQVKALPYVFLDHLVVDISARKSQKMSLLQEHKVSSKELKVCVMSYCVELWSGCTLCYLRFC